MVIHALYSTSLLVSILGLASGWWIQIMLKELAVPNKGIGLQCTAHIFC